MRIDAWLKQAQTALSSAGIPTSRLDSLVLLEDALGVDRAQLLAHPEIELNNNQLDELNEQVIRRSKHLPLAYIRGKTEFYGRNFLINEHVLEPRPESEMIIELLRPLISADKRWTVIDVGSGSGALAITTKLEHQNCDIVAIDIDEKCLQLARSNAKQLQADIRFGRSDLLDQLKENQPGNYMLLCNLPYVPESFHINQAAAHEPRLAIFGGPDGLDLYRKLFKQIDSLQSKPAYILTEALPPQHDDLSAIAHIHRYRQEKGEDFIQVFALDT